MKNAPAIIQESNAAGPMTPTAPSAENNHAEPIMPVIDNMK